MFHSFGVAAWNAREAVAVLTLGSDGHRNNSHRMVNDGQNDDSHKK